MYVCNHRKNLVIDSVFESGGTFATEWGLSNADKPPVLQVSAMIFFVSSIRYYCVSLLSLVL